MDQQHHLPEARGRSTSGASGHQRHKSVNGRSPSPAHFPNPVHVQQQPQDSSNTSSATGLGLGIGFSTSAQYPSGLTSFDSGNSFLNGLQAQTYPPQQNPADAPGAFGLNQDFKDLDFSQQLQSEDNNSLGGQLRESYTQQLSSSTFGHDFTVFPPAPGDQFNTPLFPADNQQLGGVEDSMMATMASSPNQPGSAAQSPGFFNVPSFPPSAGHSRNSSLQPEMAFNQWNAAGSLSGPQFQGHRRNPSDISDVSSVAPSPNLSVADGFEFDQGHSPMHLPQDAGLHADLQGIANFSISDHGSHSPSLHNGRSPAHSPAASPRILPQQTPDMRQPHHQQQNYLLQAHNNNASYGPPASYTMQAPEAFPSLPQTGPDMQVPNIQVDSTYAPSHGLDQPNKSALDADSLTPPDRGRPIKRQRAVTDPFNTGAAHLTHNRTTSGSASLSPNGPGSARSMSPMDRSGSGAGSLSPSPSPLGRQRRQSTSSMPNNAVALRLVSDEFGSADAGGPSGVKGRVQKHPATFQCEKCPKRFTRAYNLRSHLRTHTNERPFKCDFCPKEFARQHDRKRHQSLHSGEKKFVCKGELRGGQPWGCGRKFARADALGRHFRSEAGRVCIKPLLDEERQQQFHDQMQQAAAQGMVMQQAGLPQYNMDPNPNAYMDGAFPLPQALITQFPFLAANMSDPMADMGGGSGMDDEHSGLSNFEGSDYDGEEGGYVSGPGTGYGQGGVNENYGATGYASDYGGR